MGSRHIRGPLVLNTYKKLLTGDYTVVNESLVIVNKTIGAATAITLPAPSTADGRRAVIVIDGKLDAASNNITVAAASGNINGSASHVISENGGMMIYVDGGDEWKLGLPPSISGTEIGFLNGITAGTGLASKALVLDSSGNVAMPAAPASIDERNAEIVTGTNVIAASENGRTYYLNTAGGFTSTLPAPALGLYFRFIVKTAPTTAYIILTNSSGNVMYGHMVERAGGAGVAGAARDTFNFVANQAIIGDWVEFWSDGTNWYYHGMVDVSAGSTVAQAS